GSGSGSGSGSGLILPAPAGPGPILILILPAPARQSPRLSGYWRQMLAGQVWSPLHYGSTVKMRPEPVRIRHAIYPAQPAASRRGRRRDGGAAGNHVRRPVAGRRDPRRDRYLLRPGTARRTPPGDTPA